MRRAILTVAALALIPCALLASREIGKRREVPDSVKQLMRRKLQASQKVLEGVAIKDFELIAKYAKELKEISEEAQWKVIKTNRYEIYSKDFREITDSLVSHAKDQNLDAAALDYVDLTLTCVKCHKYVREERMTRR